MAPRKRCAFLTMDDPTGFFTYDSLAVEPLAQVGWSVEEIPWSEPNADWDAYDVVVIRSPWDYQDDPDAFMRVLELIDASTARLENPLDIVRWNIDKAYLKDLRQRGVSTVPTEWLFGLDDDALERLHQRFGSDDVIVKPVVGANADDTFWLTADAQPELLSEAMRTFSSRRLMAQPFIHSVLQEGEYSLFYFGGEFSHSIVKVPKQGDFRVQEEHGGLISSCSVDQDLLTAGQIAVDAIGQRLLYARVDLVRLSCGTLALMELELIEPSLYFANDPQSPGRFARAFEQMLGS